MRPARGSAALCTSVDGVGFALLHPSSLTNCLAVESFFLGSLLLRQSAPNQRHQTSVLFLYDKSAGSQGRGMASEPLRIEFSFLLIISHFLVLLIGGGLLELSPSDLLSSLLTCFLQVSLIFLQRIIF